MHVYTPEAAQAIESRQRGFMNRLMVDWNNNGAYDHPLSNMTKYVTRTSRDQTISSTAPEELMLIEGYAAGSLDVEVAGEYEGLSLTGHFSPYNGRSVFYAEGLQLGVDMYYEIGVWTKNGWEYFRQFTGVVREVDANRGNGIVALNCLDNVEKLRTSVDLPAWGQATYFLQRGFKRGGLTDSSAIIDLAARSGGFTMGPKPGLGMDLDETDIIFSAPMHGSFMPEIGMMDTAWRIHQTEDWEDDPDLDEYAEAYIRGPHGYLALNAVPPGYEPEGEKLYWVDESRDFPQFSLGGTFVLSAWIYWEGPGSAATADVISLQKQQNHFRLHVFGADGAVAPQVQDTAGTLHYGESLYMTENAWNYIEAVFLHDPQSDGYVDCRTRVNDVTSTPMRLINAPLVYQDDRFAGRLQVTNFYAVSDVEIVYSWYVWNWGAIYKETAPLDTADVSWGRNRITYTHKENGLEAWDLAKNVAGAEYGVVFFDEDGVFKFWNFNDVTALQDTTNRWFSLDDVEGLSMRTTMDSVRNSWKVTTQDGEVDWQVFYELGRDGVPLNKKDGNHNSVDGEYLPAIFQFEPYPADQAGYTFFFMRTGKNLVAPDAGEIFTHPLTSPWDENVPKHGLRSYTGTDYRGDDARYYTEQKAMSRDIVRLSGDNGWAEAVGFIDEEDRPRFRMRGQMITENDPYTWSVSNSDSVAKYGIRTIELGNNFWLQDEFQTRAMLEQIVEKFARPTPVTDNITVAGDPRVQIGDVIEISDPEGMGAEIRVQVFGIQREMATGSGLTDTYSVEVIQPPGKGIWDDPSYGIWDQSLIWGD